jgi:hypothetical protein
VFPVSLLLRSLSYVSGKPGTAPSPASFGQGDRFQVPQATDRSDPKGVGSIAEGLITEAGLGSIVLTLRRAELARMPE